MSSEDTIRARFEADRRVLLDLSLRNTLISHRELKSRGLRIVDERSDQLFRILVSEGRAMSFLPAPKSEGVEEELNDGQLLFEQPPDEDDRIADHHTDDKLQTPYSDSILQRRLLNTFYAARTHIEERGVNVLYLTLGILHWYESPSSEIERRAPLLLIPVELYRTNVQARFKLRYNGADLGPNHSLELKLKSEFGSVIPELPEADSLDVSADLAKVAKEVATQPRWFVEENEVALGFFSFAKLLMFEDLDAKKWPPDSHPGDHELIRKLLLEGFGGDPPVLDSDDSLDRSIDPQDIHQVLDADSSQTVAIQRILAGHDLVIQGPPGTGKSQTITNAIAEAIVAGKKVLFVAEKMAALDVVYRRLEAIGLHDACLNLHSHTANKRAFLQELERVLRLGEPGTDHRDRLVATVRDARARLNEYAEAVNEPIGDSGMSPFLVYGKLLDVQRRIEALEPPRLDREPFKVMGPETFDRLKTRLQDLEGLLGRMGVPRRHPFWGSGADVFLPTVDGPEVRESALQALEALGQFCAQIVALAHLLDLKSPETLGEAAVILNCARKLVSAPPLESANVGEQGWLRNADAVKKGISVGREIENTKASQPDLLPHAWGYEARMLRGPIAAYGGRWWRFLSGSYRGARRELAGLVSGEVPKAGADQLEAVDAILLVQRLDADLSQLRGLLARLFGEDWDATSRNWNRFDEISDFLRDVHDQIAQQGLPGEVLQLLSSNLDRDAVGQALRRAEHLESALESTVTSAYRAAKFDLDKGQRSPWPFSFDELERQLKAWTSEPGRLKEIANFNHVASELAQDGCGSLAGAAATWPNASAGITDLFLQTRYAALLELAFLERRILTGFDGGAHAKVLERFRTADRALLECNRIAIAHRHWENLPQMAGVGQVGILMHEIQKKRRHRPIRQLMVDSGRAIQAIKPVFMMSPMSIPTFIPRGSVHFDVVLFDEASQIRPVEAYGALTRSDQAVVVGDSRQLPPTSFFDLSIEEEDDGSYDERASDLESVLGQFVAKGAAQSMLRWHYRSRHESLIAVSNEEFYESNLMIFPSPDATRESLGLVFHHLPDTHYERGRGRSINREEARAVAKVVMRHARERGHRSLGVAAFSQGQAQVLQDEIELLRRRDPSCEGFFADHSEEPFFVKNLENVQGDERDVIFISVGYGKDEAGYVSMNFGPLNQNGGERRLNVLITRARYRCEVFTNMSSDDIDLNRSKARGVVAFKRFLNYAEHGILDVPQATSFEPESPFEDQVARALRDYGHEIHHQIGTGGFFVDLAVVDPEKPGRYLLGIECDGATYHSARWARDRDRLRQEVLERLGWTIHRIWSTDWFQQPETELRRALEAIEIATFDRPQPEQAPPKATFAVPRAEKAAAQEQKPLAHYEVARPSVPRKLQGSSPAALEPAIVEVVRVEGPVHLTEVVARLTNAAGFKRAGRIIRETIERAISVAARRGTIRLDSLQFLWDPGSSSRPTARDRACLPASSRKMELISPVEIRVVIEEQVRDAHGIAESEIPNAVCRRFGFARVTEKMASIVASVLREQMHGGELIDKAGVIVKTD